MHTKEIISGGRASNCLLSSPFALVFSDYNNYFSPPLPALLSPFPPLHTIMNGAIDFISNDYCCELTKRRYSNHLLEGLIEYNQLRVGVMLCVFCMCSACVLRVFYVSRYCCLVIFQWLSGYMHWCSQTV